MFVPVNLPTAYTVQAAAGVPNRQDPATFPRTRKSICPAIQTDLDALTPGNQVQLLTIPGIARNFSNGYIGSCTAGFDHDFRDVKFNVSYVATAGIHLARVYSPNSYSGADPAHAPFTQFNSAGQATGGLWTGKMMTQWLAFDLSLPAEQCKQELGAGRIGIAGQLYLFEVDR